MEMLLQVPSPHVQVPQVLDSPQASTAALQWVLTLHHNALSVNLGVSAASLIVDSRLAHEESPQAPAWFDTAPVSWPEAAKHSLQPTLVDLPLKPMVSAQPVFDTPSPPDTDIEDCVQATQVPRVSPWLDTAESPPPMLPVLSRMPLQRSSAVMPGAEVFHPLLKLRPTVTAKLSLCLTVPQ